MSHIVEKIIKFKYLQCPQIWFAKWVEKENNFILGQAWAVMAPLKLQNNMISKADKFDLNYWTAWLFLNVTVLLFFRECFRFV